MTPEHVPHPEPVLEPRRGSAGFTLVELLISLAVTAVLILGVLATFDFSARMNRVQMNVADMQQSMRIAQTEMVKLGRMAGRGGLLGTFAVQLTNNVGSSKYLVDGQASTEILEGTDVVTLRGVFESPLYQVDYLDPSMLDGPKPDGTGEVTILDHAAGVPQNLDLLEELAKAGETILLTTPDDKYHVVKVTSTSREDDVKGTFDGIHVRFESYPSNGTLGGILASDLKKVYSVGILEEQRFYVRKSGNGDSPKLARARMQPGTNLPYEADVKNAILDIADDIMDLQAVRGTGAAGSPELRLSTLARTNRRDPGKYLAPLLPALIEDHAYPTAHPFNSDSQRRFRWRLVRTDLDLRNL
jgi:prepilin-type N-terminal cleavage/methylation domain-containing protein